MALGAMIDRLRAALHRAITTPLGDRFAPIRVPKDLARRANVALGQPICSRDELAKRRAAEARLRDLRSGAAAGGADPAAAGASPATAPVMVYFEQGRNTRELARIEELLDAKSIPFTKLDVQGDEATLTFVTRRASCEADDLPVVFVGGIPVGSYPKLVEWDVSGELARALRPN